MLGGALFVSGGAAGTVQRQLEEAVSLIGEGFRIQESVLVREIGPIVAHKATPSEPFSRNRHSAVIDWLELLAGSYGRWV